MKKQQGAVRLVLAPGRMLICPPAHFTEVQRNDLPGVPGGCPHRALAWVRILFYSLFRQPHARVHAAKPARQFVQFYEVSGTLYIQVLSFCVSWQAQDEPLSGLPPNWQLPVWRPVQLGEQAELPAVATAVLLHAMPAQIL